MELRGLVPQAYEHPLDRKALDALQNTAGLDLLIRKVNEWGVERILRMQLMGSHLRVTRESIPALHAQLEEACHLLDLPRLPHLYIAPGGEVNAFTAGTAQPVVVLTAAAVDLLSDDELFFVIAHELGHIKSGHVLYYEIAEWIPMIGSIVGQATFGLGELLGLSLQVALLNWKRMSELTADRAGLLACQDANAAISAMTRLAGLPQRYFDSFNSEDFIAQARAFEANDIDLGGKIAKALSVMSQSHPWTVLRANQFLAWIDSGDYERVLRAPAQVPGGPSGFCPSCRSALFGEEIFCTGCGTRLAAADRAK